MDPLITPGPHDHHHHHHHHHDQPHRPDSSSFLPDSPPRLPSSPAPRLPSSHLPSSPRLPSSPHLPSSPPTYYSAVTVLETPPSPQHTSYPADAATATATATTVAEKNVENAGTEETEETVPAAAAAADVTEEASAATTTSTPTALSGFPTLHDFLTSLHLEQYHSACLQAGCSEVDVQLILKFDDSALKEFTGTIRMSPFHDIAFRKGVRELRDAFGHVQGQTAIADLNVKSGPPQSQVRSALGKNSSFSPGSSSKSSVPPPKPSTSDVGPRPRKRVKISAAQASSSKKKSNKNSNNNTSLATTSTIDTPTKVPASRANLYRSDSAIAHIEALTPPASTSSRNIDLVTNPGSQEVIAQHATIYGKNSNRALTAYEQAINSASIELALADPALLANKGALFDRAKSRLLDEGYTYKRGQSRSKLNPHAPRPGQRASKEQIRAKRNANAQSTSLERNMHIQELERQLRDKDLEREQMEDLLRQSTAAGDQQRMNDMQDALKSLESSRVEIAKELSKQKGKERKHQWYEKKKKEKVERMDSGFGDDEDVPEGRDGDGDGGDAVRVANMDAGLEDKDGEGDVEEDMDQDQDQNQDQDGGEAAGTLEDEQPMEEGEDEDEEEEEGEEEKEEVLMVDGLVTADSQQQHAHQEQDAREVNSQYTSIARFQPHDRTPVTAQGQAAQQKHQDAASQV